MGLATARALLRARPDLSVLVLEKEADIAGHQTGRNSGVVHSGLYYRPGSAKAALCTSGRAELLTFVAERGIAHDVCGKVVVATSVDEEPALEELARRAKANGVPVHDVGPERLRELEPHAAGRRALHVPGTAIVDFVGVARAFAEDVEGAGEVRTSTPVREIRERASESVVVTDREDVRARVVVNCAGLHSDELAAPSRPRSTQIIPFRGEYFELAPVAVPLVRGLIYPVPDPRFPFLGVHLTRTVGGGVHVGPNAVLALAREGYRWGDVSGHDILSMLLFPGSWRLFRRHWRAGMAEVVRSIHRATFVRSVQKLVPDVRPEHLVRSPAGVRAQAVGRDGTLHDDFVIVERPRAVHVLNAPSPAATASLAIGRRVAEVALRAI